MKAVVGLLISLLACAATTLGAMPVVIAQPVPGAAEEPAAPPPIDWPQLGLPDELILASSAAQKTIMVPVPEGYRPAALTGRVEAVSNAVNCTVEVYDGENNYLGPVAPVDGQTTAPFVVDLSQAAAGKGGMELSFHLRQSGPPAELCTQLALPSSMALSRLATTYTGAPIYSDTIAGFLPDYLSRIVVAIGSNPPLDVQQAALTLVAHLTHLYRPLPVRIDVDTSAQPPVPDEPYGGARVIAIRESPTAGLSILDGGTAETTLLIAGRGDALREQVQLFADRRFEIAQSDTTTIMAAAQFPIQAATVKTFGELGMAGQLSVIGTDTMYLGFDAAEFGIGSIEGAEIDIVAKYTPVVDGHGSVLIRAGPHVIATHMLDQSGNLEIDTRIPADVIQSKVGLALEIRYLPQQSLAPPARISFAVLPESTVQVTPGTQTSRGFSVLPMAFVPQFEVAVDHPDRIRFAAAAINLLGQQTSVTLRPRLTPLDEATASAAGLLIVATAEELSRRNLSLPIGGSGSDQATIAGEPTTKIDLDGPLGVIQTATTDTRTVLAITGANDWQLVDETFDYIRALNGQWSALTGDVVITGAMGDSINLTIDQGGGWQDLSPGSGWTRWAWLSLTVLAVVILLVISVALFRIKRERMKRATPRQGAPDEQSSWSHP